MSTEIKTLDELELFVGDLEEKLDKAVRSVFDELPVKVPCQVEVRGIWVSFTEVNEMGEGCNKYIPQRPAVEMDINIKSRRR